MFRASDSLNTWYDNKVSELITSLLNIAVVTFKTISELVLWNCLQSCRRITPDVINVIKMPPF
jgi:hypothetical protein